MSIERLPTVSTVSPSDVLALYSQSLGKDAGVTLATFLAWLEQQAGSSGSFVTQYAAPNASGFNVLVNPPLAGVNVYLLLMPAGPLATGTITLPDVTQCLDHQQLLVTCTVAVSSLTVNGNGATITGAPASLAAGTAFCLQFDQITQAWYIVSGSSVSSGGGGGGAVNSVNGQTGTVIIDKAAVGLSAVDNTSDSFKNSASVALTNKTIDGTLNTFLNIPQSAVAGLLAALANLTPTSRTLTINGTTLDLTANRSWTISASGLTDGDKGDITVSGTGTVWTIDANSVTLAKLAAMTVGVIGNTSGTATPSVIGFAALKAALAIAAADVAGSVISFSSGRNFVAADNNATVVFAAVTGTIPTGLSGFNVIGFPPASGNVTITPASGVTINGGSSSVVLSGTQPFSILQTGTNSYFVGANSASGVPTSRQLTINGVAQDLSADRSWTVPGSVIPVDKLLTPVTVTDASATETTVFTTTVPVLSAGDTLDVTWYVENPASATVKTFRAKIAGTAYHVDQNTTQTAMYLKSRLTVLTSTSQLGPINYSGSSDNGTNNATATSANVAATTTLTLTVQWGTAGSGTNSIVCKYAIVRVNKGA